MSTIAELLDRANPNDLADALRKIKLGTMLTPKKAALTQAAGTAVTLDPPALIVQHARVTTGVSTGNYIPTDSGGTAAAPSGAAPGVVKVSDDGATLTFNANVEALTVTYIPRSDTDITTDVPGHM